MVNNLIPKGEVENPPMAVCKHQHFSLNETVRAMDIEKKTKEIGNGYCIYSLLYAGIASYLIWMIFDLSESQQNILDGFKEIRSTISLLLVLFSITISLGIFSRRFIRMSPMGRVILVIASFALSFSLLGNICAGIWALYTEGAPDWYSWIFLAAPSIVALTYLYYSICLNRVRKAITLPSI